LVYYIIERRQFITHAQEEIPRKGGTISTPEREGRQAISCLLYKYIKPYFQLQVIATILGGIKNMLNYPYYAK